jgi:phosphoribosylanthranilate isomerase
MKGREMTWVKICGVTNLEDALVAVEAGADAVGFVFYEKSPRCVTVEMAREICSKLPESVEKVGVFVGVSPRVPDISRQAGLTMAQIYVHEQPALTDEYLMQLPCRVIAAISVGAIGEKELRGFRVSQEVRGHVVAALIDSGNSERPGGTGERFDWGAVADLARCAGINLVVAGGLRADNVGEAISILKPWGVDVASGVEMRPGKKDPEKVRAFVRAVRETDAQVASTQ